VGHKRNTQNNLQAMQVAYK